MRDPRSRAHVLGLRDLFFYDLATRRVAYTRGYRQTQTNLAATIGLGRTLSRGLLDLMSWKLWEDDRNRGLDQSAVRQLFSRFPSLDSVALAVLGRDAGVIAVDLKSADLTHGGTNIWSFNAILDSVRTSGRLSNFTLEDPYDILAEFMPYLEALPARILSDKGAIV
mmetsp:Transcript_6124/g.11981  ORF Transcript_6124/g.11981 Transcript_6124/m.11981 type:complete len:167 (+) Transcript_6124:1279-1779(+)